MDAQDSTLPPFDVIAMWINGVYIQQHELQYPEIPSKTTNISSKGVESEQTCQVRLLVGNHDSEKEGVQLLDMLSSVKSGIFTWWAGPCQILRGEIKVS